MRGFALPLLVLSGLSGVSSPALADYRITRDFGGLVEQYKAKYTQIRDRKERVIIDGICNSACTLVLGMIPLNRVCVTPKASLGFHQAYIDKSWTFGVKVMSYAGTADLVSYYPATVKDWIKRHGGLTPEMKRVKTGPELGPIVAPCPKDFCRCVPDAMQRVALGRGRVLR